MIPLVALLMYCWCYNGNMGAINATQNPLAPQKLKLIGHSACGLTLSLQPRPPHEPFPTYPYKARAFQLYLFNFLLTNDSQNTAKVPPHVLNQKRSFDSGKDVFNETFLVLNVVKIQRNSIQHRKFDRSLHQRIYRNKANSFPFK